MSNEAKPVESSLKPEVQSALDKVLPTLEHKNFFKKNPELTTLIARCTIEALLDSSQKTKASKTDK